MRRFLLNKLIVISKKEEKSKEIDFKKGLNIILGANKTGKSSIIKSIFYALGCEVKFESEWKLLIDKYLLYFTYGEKEYLIVRTGKYFELYKIRKGNFILIIETEHFHDYSEELMKIFEISMDFITNKGKKIAFTPPLLFRFQYIDQDLGWEKIGESFNNLKYIMDWKSNTNKYVVGFQGEEYYKTKLERDLAKENLDQFNTKISHYNEFINNLKLSMVNFDPSFESMNIKAYSDDKLLSNELNNAINNLKKDLLILQDELALLKNERYEKHLELKYLKEYLSNLDKDHEFAMKEDSQLVCPFCGTVHENDIEHRIELIKDMQKGNHMIGSIREDLSDIDNKITQLEAEIKTLNNTIRSYQIKLEKNKENTNLINSYKEKGKVEVIQDSISKRDEITLLRDNVLGEILEIDNEIKIMKSTKRRNKIRNNLLKYCREIFEDVNLPESDIKLNDFVQVLNRTGSENPRMIYAYHVALYLYNLNRIKSPFNFLVIDTPNQQGQDEKNLKNIFSVLDRLCNPNGQVIMGTERETGFETEANNVVTLENYKRSLNKVNYKDHIELLNRMQNKVR
ncbi:AAA family ATPase [Oceanobacillus kimchii]|uniref:AAA family ATPase n=1 Tax=Oceanobacillus kimchii TaxID=746691 RepID=UPI003C7315A2